MRVVVTRPEHEARRWALALSDRGFEVSILPLIAIQPVADLRALRSAWERLADYAALMFVSAAAVEHFFAARLPSDIDLSASSPALPRAWVTGPGTAAALQQRGVSATRVDAPESGSAQFDSEALWAVVERGVRAGDRVLVVRGADGVASASAPPASGAGRDWLARQLAQAGAQVDFVVAYRRALPALSDAQTLQARMAAADGSCWLFTSAQAAANLLSLLPGQEWSGARAVATHPRIAAAVRAAGFGVVCESRPGLSAVVASIESIR